MSSIQLFGYWTTVRQRVFSTLRTHSYFVVRCIALLHMHVLCNIIVNWIRTAHANKWATDIPEHTKNMRTCSIFFCRNTPQCKVMCVSVLWCTVMHVHQRCAALVCWGAIQIKDTVTCAVVFCQVLQCTVMEKWKWALSEVKLQTSNCVQENPFFPLVEHETFISITKNKAGHTHIDFHLKNSSIYANSKDGRSFLSSYCILTSDGGRQLLEYPNCECIWLDAGDVPLTKVDRAINFC